MLKDEISHAFTGTLMHYYDVLQLPICTGRDFDILLSLGWYPMGQTIFTTSHLFREDGSVPKKVHWIRYDVSSVSDRASHRRIRKKNSPFQIELADPFSHSDELHGLYDKYLDSVDFDGYASIENATFSSNESNIYKSKAIIVRDGEKIIACGIFHEGDLSVASVLHFYDPEYNRYSPGKYLILKTLDYCREKRKIRYYPGYIIEGDPKMNYKLFLGDDVAEFYSPDPHPLSGSWLPFSKELLTDC